MHLTDYQINLNRELALKHGVFEGCLVSASIGEGPFLPGLIRLGSDDRRIYLEQDYRDGSNIFTHEGIPFMKYKYSYVFRMPTDRFTNRVTLTPDYSQLFKLLDTNNIKFLIINSEESVVVSIFDKNNDININKCQKLGFNQAFAITFLNFIDILKEKNLNLANRLMFYGYNM